MSGSKPLAGLGCVLALAACGAPSAGPRSDGGPGGASSSTTAAASSASSSSGSTLGGPDAGVSTPISLADAWVAGWYGATSHRGDNTYSHVATAGYPGGYYTVWRGDPGISRFGNVTDCSSFSDVLLTRAFGWLPPTTNPRPLAEDYYWAIRQGSRLQEITRASDLAVGDLLALLYGTADAGGDTGHVAWIDALPEPYTDEPTEAGLTQLAVTIIDSADGFHDAPPANAAHQDDRYLGPLAGAAMCATDAQCVAVYGASATCNTTSLGSQALCAYIGVGRGQMRLYVDATGAIAGYTWGTSSASTFYARPSPLPTKGAAFTGRDIVAARYVSP